DHGLETIPPISMPLADANRVFDLARAGERVDASYVAGFKGFMLRALALMYHRAGWVQQFHLGALRNTNTRMRRTLGADSGLDSVGDFELARPLAQFLDSLDESNQLAKTILYNLNPRDNELLATMIGNF